MKVKDLITELCKCDIEAEVIISSDPDGKNYMKTYSVSKDLLAKKKEKGRNYEIFFDEDLAKELYKDAVYEKCVVIYPS